MKWHSGKAVPMFLLLVLLGAGGLVAAIYLKVERQQREPLPKFASLGEFTFTERSERPVTQADVAGKILVVDFFFASCSAECQVLGRRMRRVQELTSGMEDVMLLSFTVDPMSDTPKVLARRAEELSASTNRWLFLTGPKTNLYPFIETRFLLAAAAGDAGPSGGYIHSSKIVLVDRLGVVRGYYDGLAVAAPDRILRDIQRLRNEDSGRPDIR
ncbi:MAG: SCO family protein [Verrucomicrobiota bacterium]